MTIHEKLVAIQSSLVAPKSQTNAFGKYKYRSCEDILEALKPLLKEHNLILTLTDDIVEVGGRVYVKACAMLGDGETTVPVFAFARESLDKKGMDEAQITGAASSYARKYALNGLFCIDDTKDADTMKPIGQRKLADKEDVVKIRSLCNKIDKDYGACLSHYTDGDWTPETAKKAITELTAATNNLSKKLDSL